MSTVNGPFPPPPRKIHLPIALASPDGFQQLNGLCGEPVLSTYALTQEVNKVSCATCLWAMFAVLLQQQSIVAAALATMHTVALPMVKLPI